MPLSSSFSACSRRAPASTRSNTITNHASGAVANLVVLAARQLHEQLCDLVLDPHLRQDGCAVVGDGDVAVGRDQDLVQP